MRTYVDLAAFSKIYRQQAIGEQGCARQGIAVNLINSRSAKLSKPRYRRSIDRQRSLSMRWMYAPISLASQAKLLNNFTR